MLFNRGANPNTVLNRASIWQRFLYRMGIELSSPGIGSNQVRANAHSWGAAISAFLEHGADVNDTIQFDYPKPFANIANYENHSKLCELVACDLVLYQSVLSFLQQFSHVLPEFPQIQSQSIWESLKIAIDEGDCLVVKQLCIEARSIPERPKGFVLRALQKKNFAAAHIIIEHLGSAEELRFRGKKGCVDALRYAAGYGDLDLFKKIMPYFEDVVEPFINSA